MPILDSQGNPLPPTKGKDAKQKSLKTRVAAIATLVTAVAVFVGNVDTIWSTVSGWISGKKEEKQTVVVQITTESLLEAARQFAATGESVAGRDKREAEEAARNLNSAAQELATPISLTGTSDKSPAWLLAAMEEVGQQEVSGTQHNKRILEYIRSASPSMASEGDELPWNSFFVNWVFAQSGIEGTNSGAARSWLGWGKSLYQPKPGAVAIFQRGRNPMAGFVGIYVGDAGDYVLCVAGNVANAVRINAIPKSRLLGYRWPMNA